MEWVGDLAERDLSSSAESLAMSKGWWDPSVPMTFRGNEVAYNNRYHIAATELTSLATAKIREMASEDNTITAAE